MATNQTEIVNDLVDNVKLLLSSDTSLESLKEIELCVKQNRIDLESVELSKITGLEEALALKVNIADIVDDLVSTLADVPLSANQGRVLSEQLSSLTLSDIAETDTLKHFTKELKEKLENLSSSGGVNEVTVPTGLIMINPTTVIPSGFLECNGAEVSREEYSSLFSVIGTLYGEGDSSTTFNLPDLRGEFVRGFDNSRGIDTDRTLGSYQAPSLITASIGPDAIQVLTIEGETSNLATNEEFNKGMQTDNIVDEDYASTLKGTNHVPAKYAYTGNGTVSVDPHADRPLNNNDYIKVGGARPRNIAMMYCIKY